MEMAVQPIGGDPLAHPEVVFFLQSEVGVPEPRFVSARRVDILDHEMEIRGLRSPFDQVLAVGVRHETQFIQRINEIVNVPFCVIETPVRDHPAVGIEGVPIEKDMEIPSDARRDKGVRQTITIVGLVLRTM